MLTTSADTKIQLHVCDVYFRRVPFSHQPTAGRKWPVTKICFHFLKFLSLKYCFCFIWKEGLVKKMHCGGILTWQSCASDFIITRDVKHYELYEPSFKRLEKFVFVLFAKPYPWYTTEKNKHANHLPVIIRAIFSERYSEYVLVPRYSWHQDHCQCFFVHRTTFAFCCNISYRH